MQYLADILLQDGTRQRFVREIVDLIDEEVDRRTGLVGLTVRGGYHFFKKVRGDVVRDALDDMIDAFVRELEPLYIAHGTPESFGEFMAHHRSLVARRMLKVTDARREDSRSVSIRKTYDAISPFAAANVERSIPRLGEVIQRYVDEFIHVQPALGCAAV